MSHEALEAALASKHFADGNAEAHGHRRDTCQNSAPHLPVGSGGLHGSLSHSPNSLDVRLGFSLCQEEVEFLQKREVVVAKALSQVLQQDLHEDEVGKLGHWPRLRGTLGYWSSSSMFC